MKKYNKAQIREFSYISLALAIVIVISFVAYAQPVPNDSDSNDIDNNVATGDFTVTFENSLDLDSNTSSLIRIDYGNDEIYMAPIGLGVEVEVQQDDSNTNETDDKPQTSDIDFNLQAGELDVEGNVANYHNQFGTNIDLKYTFWGNSLKEEIIIDSKEDLVSPLPQNSDSDLILRFRVDIPEGVEVREEEVVLPLINQEVNQVVLELSEGELYMPAPEHHDANGEILYTDWEIVEQNENSILMQFKVPMSWLLDAEYPIYLDPTVTTLGAVQSLTPATESIVYEPGSNLGDYFVALHSSTSNRVQLHYSSNGVSWSGVILDSGSQKPGLMVLENSTDSYFMFYYEDFSSEPTIWKEKHRPIAGSLWSSEETMKSGGFTAQSCESASPSANNAYCVLRNFTDLLFYSGNVGGWGDVEILETNSTHYTQQADLCYGADDAHFYVAAVSNYSVDLYHGSGTEAEKVLTIPITGWKNNEGVACAVDEDNNVYIAFVNNSEGYVAKTKDKSLDDEFASGYKTPIIRKVSDSNTTALDLATNGNYGTLVASVNDKVRLFESFDFDVWSDSGVLLDNVNTTNPAIADTLYADSNRLADTLRLVYQSKVVSGSSTVYFNETSIADDSCTPEIDENWDVEDNCIIEEETEDVCPYNVRMQSGGTLTLLNGTEIKAYNLTGVSNSASDNFIADLSQGNLAWELC